MSNLNDVVGAPACGTTDPAPACGTKGPAPACGTACDSADSKAAPACGSAKLSVGGRGCRRRQLCGNHLCAARRAR